MTLSASPFATPFGPLPPPTSEHEPDRLQVGGTTWFPAPCCGAAPLTTADAWRGRSLHRLGHDAPQVAAWWARCGELAPVVARHAAHVYVLPASWGDCLGEEVCDEWACPRDAISLLLEAGPPHLALLYWDLDTQVSLSEFLRALAVTLWPAYLGGAPDHGELARALQVAVENADRGFLKGLLRSAAPRLPAGCTVRPSAE